MISTTGGGFMQVVQDNSNYFMQQASAQGVITADGEESVSGGTTENSSEQLQPTTTTAAPTDEIRAQQHYPPTTLTTTECPPGMRPGTGTATSGQCIPDISSSLEEENFFYLEDQRVPIAIGLDELGIAARDNVTSGQLQEFLSRFQLELIAEYPQNIFIFGLTGNLSRPEIVDLSRIIASEGVQLVAYAGFSATQHGAEAPFIVTDEFIAKFREDITPEQIASYNNDNRVEIVKPDPFVKNQFLLQVNETSPLDALDMANRYHENNNSTEFAHPNFVRVIEFRQFIPNDPLFGNQWQHQNDGLAGETIDADVDTPLAWDITQGARGTIIAVIDDGFDMTHPDLEQNFWINTGEVPGNGLDDDGNNCVDDIHGCDFGEEIITNMCPNGWCYDGNPAAGPSDHHGTAVAGAAAAQGNNALGVAGSCPNCSLMLLRQGVSAQTDAEAINYAWRMGAQIITNSWDYAFGTSATTVVVNAINNAATMGRDGLGSVVFFAMSNSNVDRCDATPPVMSSLDNVIAISSSTNRDQFDLSGFGNCMDVLAPSNSDVNLNLSSPGTTTDRQGVDGYNDDDPIPQCRVTEPDPPPDDARDYTFCFSGTSFATPLTAGIAGLILTVNPSMTRLQVQQLLQDSADKIEDSAGSYATGNGFSTPAGTSEATHGWGRVNAFEAVRAAAPVAQGGLEGTDIFLRDNRLDWGNTEQPSNTLFEPTRGVIGHWLSQDIKVDAPPYQSAPVTGADFENLIDETPSAVAGDLNRVYVRVHNRGPATDPSVTVKLHWAQYGTALPTLPRDFWTAFPADSSDTTQWHPLDCTGTSSSTCTVANLTYSGSSVASTAADGAQIVSFDFPAPSVNPGLSNHFCLLAMIDSDRDPISQMSRNTFVVDDITPRDNNVSHRNYLNLPTSRNTNFHEGFFVRNPTNETIQAVLRLEAPEDWTISISRFDFNEVFTLGPNQEVPVSMNVSLPELGQQGDVNIIQERPENNQSSVVMGGVSYHFSAALEIAEDCLAFNPQTTSVIQVNGVWTIADDGSDLILAFPSKAEADQSLSIIKKYGFSNICFTGRPDPSMMYFLR
jgi:subtilisin family serine protease